ncbi:MAG: hypothetical protein ACRD29_00015 [Acidimicrobiales bacterium]
MLAVYDSRAARYDTVSPLTAGPGRPTLILASKRRSARRHRELAKMTVTLAAIATVAHTG